MNSVIEKYIAHPLARVCRNEDFKYQALFVACATPVALGCVDFLPIYLTAPPLEAVANRIVDTICDPKSIKNNHINYSYSDVMGWFKKNVEVTIHIKSVTAFSVDTASPLLSYSGSLENDAKGEILENQYNYPSRKCIFRVSRSDTTGLRS